MSSDRDDGHPYSTIAEVPHVRVSAWVLLVPHAF